VIVIGRDLPHQKKNREWERLQRWELLACFGFQVVEYRTLVQRVLDEDDHCGMLYSRQAKGSRDWKRVNWVTTLWPDLRTQWTAGQWGWVNKMRLSKSNSDFSQL
jgi:hypothetical protein